VHTASFLGPKRSTKLLALLFASVLASTAWGDEQRLSISGYDPVAYFTDECSAKRTLIKSIC